MKRARTVALAVLLPLLGGGCQLARDAHSASSAAASPAARGACPRASVVAAGGWDINEGTFSFHVPLGFEQLDVAPVGGDDRIALFDSANGRMTLVSELAARPHVGPAAAAPLLRCREAIGGRVATLVVFRIDSTGHPAQRLRHGRYVAEARWADPVEPGRYLTVRGESADSAALGLLLASLRSVRFASGGDVARK
jgi:hypothetical protein